MAKLEPEPELIRVAFSKCSGLSGLVPSTVLGAIERGHLWLREPERAGHRAVTDLSSERGPPAAFRQANPQPPRMVLAIFPRNLPEQFLPGLFKRQRSLAGMPQWWSIDPRTERALV